MTKSIHFTQQVPFDYLPLKLGLGLISESDFKSHPTYQRLLKQGVELCPKAFTTRTMKLHGHYTVSQGSRYKPTPVNPPIEFTVSKSYPLYLDNERIMFKGTMIPIDVFKHWNYVNLTYPELDLGIKGVTFNDLKEVLMQLTNGSESQFYINKLEPVRKPRLPMVI